MERHYLSTDAINHDAKYYATTAIFFCLRLEIAEKFVDYLLTLQTPLCKLLFYIAEDLCIIMLPAKEQK